MEDWAASDCLTSAEWAAELFPLFPHLDFVASDLLLFLWEAKKQRGEERFILEPDGTPLQYVRPPFVVRLSQPEPKAVFCQLAGCKASSTKVESSSVARSDFPHRL